MAARGDQAGSLPMPAGGDTIATSWRNNSSSASFDAAERQQSDPPGQAGEYQVEHPYGHKAAMLPVLPP
jgi:hypothetical protein